MALTVIIFLIRSDGCNPASHLRFFKYNGFPIQVPQIPIIHLQNSRNRSFMIKMQKRNAYILAVLIVIALISCSKESKSVPQFFYGKWKANYGDTLVFSRSNGRNIVTYNNSMNSLNLMRADHEFTYRDEKLGVIQWSGTQEFNFFSSFRWIQPGESFEIQGIQWFGFLNSTMTYFTFTKIP